MIPAVVFLSAALLFLVQPMVARQVLPELGGSAAVWTTCVAFFQLTLLAGYAYAHLLVGRLPVRWGAAVHLGVAALAASTLPVGLAGAGEAPVDGSPVPWLLGALARGVGPAFLVLAATSPLVSAWLAASRRPGAADPYPLYAASNLGSALALVVYPLLLEPGLALAAQRASWSVGYLVLVLGLAAAAAQTLGPGGLRGAAAPGPAGTGADGARHDPAGSPGGPGRERLGWLVYSAVPASLMLGVTAHMANEVPALALLWVVPLFLYLATLALVFAPRPPVPPGWAEAAHPFLLGLVAILLFIPVPLPVFTVHLAAFFASGLVLHGELARRRPAPARLTEYYLWTATGGAFAGLFHAVLAPVVFPFAAEYPLAIMAAAALQPEPPPPPPPEAPEDEARRLVALAGGGGDPGGREARGAPDPASAAPGAGAPGAWDLLPALGLGLGLVLAMLALPWYGDLRDGSLRVGLLAGAGMAALALRGRRLRFALALGGVLAGGLVGVRMLGLVAMARSAHGEHRVVRDPGTGATRLYCGSTFQGVELAAAAGGGPSNYFHPDSAIGRLLTRAGTRGATVGVIGLGSGSVAWFTRPGQRMVIYELDPVVAALAADPRHFSFLARAQGRVTVELGDGRRRLRTVPDGSFDLLLVDAFNSDAVPIHLLTEEALRLDLAKLAPGGVLGLHVSNRHLRLEVPALAGLARLGARASRYGPGPLDEASRARGISVSTWILAARRDADLAPWLDGEPGWREPGAVDPGAAWTDGFASVLPILKGFR